MLLLFWRSPSQPQQYLDLWDFLHSWLDANPPAGLTGGIWSESAPKGTVVPFATERSRSSESTKLIGPQESASHQIDFAIFALSREQAEVFVASFRATFSNFWSSVKEQTFADGSVCDRWEKTKAGLRKDPDRGPAGEPIWIADLGFEAETSKSIP